MSTSRIALIETAKDYGGVSHNYVLWQTTRIISIPDGQRVDSIRYEIGVEAEDWPSYHRIVLGRFWERGLALKAYSRLLDWYGEWLSMNEHLEQERKTKEE